MTLLSIVVPVYFNEGSLRQLYERIVAVTRQLSSYNFEFIMVDDGSGDNSFAVLNELARQDVRLKVVKLVKNHGSTIAILVGLKEAKGDAAVVISADLQDPPEMILDMVPHWEAGKRMVLAARTSRDDPFSTRLTGNLFNFLFRKYVFPKFPKRGFDCYMIDRKVIDIVSQCTEKNTHLPGLLMWTGFEYELIYYKRVRREHGKSRWNLSRKIKYFADAFTAFSYIPIRMGTLLGLFMSLLGFLYAGVVILLSLFGGIKIEGWSSLMIVVLILGGSQMIMLGILGEYLWRNFDQTRHRPLYLIDQVVKYENTSPNQNRLNSNHDKVPGNLDGTRI